jgi:predicted RNase H-like nuclease (RuvC/YqgF family)
MGLFDNKDYERMIGRLEGVIEHLKEENSFLRKQLERTQEALIAKESPVAYEHQKADEAAGEERELDPEEQRRNKIEKDIYKRHLTNIENPLFSDVDDMMDMLRRNLGIPESESLHNNEES